MTSTHYILAGSFIDGSGTTIRKNIFLAVQDGIISAIGSANDLSGFDRTAIIDFSHCTLVPALVDCSVSLLQSPALQTKTGPDIGRNDSSENSAMFERHIRYCHAHGVLGVVENNDITDLLVKYREDSAGQKMVTLRLPGYDYLKIYYSPDIDSRDAPARQTGFEELRRTLQNRQVKKAVVVANGRQHVADAIRAGCDAVEQGYGMGEDNLRDMAEKDILWIPEVLQAKNGLDNSGSGGDVCCRFSTRYVAPGKAIPGAENYWKKILADQLSQLRFARSLGVKTAVGTGAGNTGILHGESVVEEIKLFIKAGYSLGDAIACASENSALFFGMEKLGKLAVGKKATFLITRGTPQQLPRKLAYLEGIYIEGLPSNSYAKNPS